MRRLFVLLFLIFFIFSFGVSADVVFGTIGNEKGAIGCSTLHYPNDNMRAVYEEHIYPIENLTNPPLPLPDKNFKVDVNYLMMAEGATIVNVVSAHPWWQVKNKKIYREKGVSTTSFEINGSWNPVRQPVQDWPIEERGCSVVKIEYQIDNPSFFGLGIWVNGEVQFFYGLSLGKQDDGSWKFESRPGYQFPIPWTVTKKERAISISWSALKAGR